MRPDNKSQSSNASFIELLNNLSSRNRLSSKADGFAETLLAKFTANPVPGLIVDSKNGRILDVSAMFGKVFGFAGAEISGKLLIEIPIWPDNESIKQITDSPRLGEKGLILNLNNREREKDSYQIVIWPIRQKNESRLMCFFEKIEKEYDSFKDNKRLLNSIRSDSEYEQIFEAAMPMIVISIDCTMTNINNSYSEKYKVQKHELIGRKCFDIYPGPLCHTSRCPIERILRGSLKYEYEDISLLDDGTKIISIATAIPLRGDDGEIVGIVESFTDITERKMAEKALKASEKFNRAVIEKSPLGVSVRSRTGKLLTCNDAWKKIWGKSDDEINTYLEEEDRPELIFDNKDAYLEDWHEEIAKIYTEGGYLYIPEAKSKHYTKKSGRWVAQHFYAIMGNNNEVDRVVILTEDITERKRAEEALKESELKFREALKNSRDVLYRLNVRTMAYDYLSESVYPLIGYTPEEICALGVNGMRSLAHPNDLKRIGNHRESLINIEIGEEQSFITEYRIKCRDGQYKWLSDSHALVRDKNGNPEYIIGSVRDITSNKLAEEALIESEERFRTVVSSSKDAMVAIDSEGRTILFNPAAEKLFGYSQGQVLNQTADMLMPGIFRPYFWKYVHGYFRQNDYSELFGRTFEVVALNSDDKQIPAEISVSVGETDGRPFALAVIRDISDRKIAERALKESEERYRLLIENANQPIFTVSYDGIFLTMNNVAAQYHGGKPADFIGKSIHDLFEKVYADIHLKHIREVIDSGTKTVREQKTIIHKEVRWFIMSMQPLVEIIDGETIRAALLIANDITQRKRIETRERAKTRLLDNLRRMKTISDSLDLCCETILEAGLFARAILTIHDNERQIAKFGSAGIDRKEIKKALKAAPPSKELAAKMTDDKFKISHSYFIPEGEQSLDEITGRCIPSRETSRPAALPWLPNDALFVPLMNEKEEPEGWLSVDSPFNSKRPNYDDITYLEELVDIVGKHVRQIRSLELLQNERKALKDKNITLREVLAHMEGERLEIKRQIAEEVENNLIPIVGKLVKPNGTLNKTCYNILTSSLQALVSQSGSSSIQGKLSPREIEICNLIKENKSSKEICEALNISQGTIRKHRESIRYKLGLTNSKINLKTYLQES